MQQLVVPPSSLLQLFFPQTKLCIQAMLSMHPPSPRPQGDPSVQQVGGNVGFDTSFGAQSVLPLNWQESVCKFRVGLSGYNNNKRIIFQGNIFLLFLGPSNGKLLSL